MNDHNIEPDAQRSPACEAWIDDLFVRMFRLIRIFEKDNFDSDRYRTVAPNSFFAEASLRRWRLRLAISLYHHPDDFFTIPLWLDSLGLGYKFFLKHYSVHYEETVLFAKA
jgi:hypothetical protein